MVVLALIEVDEKNVRMSRQEYDPRLMAQFKSAFSCLLDIKPA